MGNAAAAIRKGKLQAYTALEKAGLNNSSVKVLIQISQTGGQAFAGNRGTITKLELDIKPNPEIVFVRKTFATDSGLQDQSNVTLKGAFPEALKGFQLVMIGDTETERIGIVKQYATPQDFRAELMKADYFIIDGERYRFQGDGYLNVNKTQSEWTLQLIKAK